jgi:hypothetical protein
VARVVSLAISAALGIVGFTATYTLAARGMTTTPTPRRAPSPRQRALEPDVRPPQAIASAVNDAGSQEAEDPAVALFHAVNEAYPEVGRLTWALIDQATARAMSKLIATNGWPASACGVDGNLDDSIFMVQWAVSTRHAGVTIDGGRAIDRDLTNETRGCLDRYLAHAKASFPASEQIVELDILYELPFPARDQRE